MILHTLFNFSHIKLNKSNENDIHDITVNPKHKQDPMVVGPPWAQIQIF